MGAGRIIDVLNTPLKRFSVHEGDVLHAMKYSDDGFVKFGEAYFSTIKKGAIKGWKRHKEMTLNLIVPVGEVLFVIYDDRPNSYSENIAMEVRTSKENYCRLTVPPMLWLAFQGFADNSVILNIADIPHEPTEVNVRPLPDIKFEWDDIV
jgi:dTDP-4-dehydrorhamnose 3,5-epimerase